ncbi:TROVE domain-containing protein [Actinomadura luteofluorescens]|uniref:TROVE domain-containing protein n=1 Tax=Actinomadura luteofluorescens TaxID=46163 RepID=UPI0036345DBB
MFDAVAADGVRAVNLATEVSTARPPRAPKNRPALFVMAAAAARGDAGTRQAVKASLARVARTTDHLASFFGYWKNLGGKASGSGSGTAPVIGRAMRTALASWFLNGDVDQVAWRVCKARQRRTPAGEAFALRDALRIAHPKADSPARRALFGWIAGNVSDDDVRAHVPAVDAFLTAQAVTGPVEAIEVVRSRGVPWEFLPDAVLTEPDVWDELVDTIGMTALLRNLSRMTRIGTLTPMGDATRRAAGRLTDAARSRRPGSTRWTCSSPCACTGPAARSRTRAPTCSTGRRSRPSPTRSKRRTRSRSGTWSRPVGACWWRWTPPGP